jgi:penicillin G amidase
VRRALRWLLGGALTLALLVSIGLASSYLWLRQSLPTIDGTIEVQGLGAPVEIVRDAYAVPHIEAASFEDAIFAQGFVHAQDRLWQMDFRRRLGAGRLAEVMGQAALPTDRFMRTLGLQRAAEASLAHLPPGTVALLEAYAAGFNAYLATRTGPLPPEFLIFGYRPEPWQPVDSLVFLRLLALDLSLNWRDELLRARLAKRLTEQQIADLWPGSTDAPITMVELARRLPADALAAVLPPAPPQGQGSNAWVVNASRTTTGAPLLANDPHLRLAAPGPWYLAHLKSPERELIGASMPGLPGVVLGHNGHIAWGFTNTGPDTQDLFIERVDPDDPGQYLTPDGWAPFATRDETIEVADSDPVTLRVRATRHGPVLSDLVPATGAALDRDQVLALSWTGLAEDDVSMAALLDLSGAVDWPGFVAAARRSGSPQQNVLYADTAGHIGFIAPGRVPIRAKGDGRWPVPGWTGEFDWQGVIPFDQLPQAQDPPDGAFVNANNRIVPDDYPYLITADWEAPHRARRIVELLDGGRQDLASFAALQADQLSLLARDLLPIMLEAEPPSEAARTAAARLRAWDRVMREDAPEPLIFAAWYRELSRRIYADELGDLFFAYWGVRPQFMEHVLKRRSAWCDDVGTRPVETCREQAALALEEALADLSRRFGSDQGGWRWGKAHPARMLHPVFQDQPLLAWLFTIVHESGGDNVTVNVGHYAPANEADPFASVHAASYRGLYDLADLDRSRFVAMTGQSGNPLSAHYRDLAELWARSETIPMTRRAGAYEQGAIGRLTLSPQPPDE